MVQFNTFKLIVQFNTNIATIVFNFRSFSVGYCLCGSRFVGIISSNGIDDLTVTCKISPGCQDKKCGTAYVRKKDREQIAKELEHEHVHVYRARQANALMYKTGDVIPPILPNAATLHTLKSQEKRKTYLDPNPINAIEILKRTRYAGSIHCIWHNPFCVHYWTNLQIDVSRRCFAKGITKISIDATGGICNKLDSKEIFLYQITVNCKQQFTIGQMLSTCHITDTIQYWLQMWIKSGAPVPREVVVDGSPALMNAVARAFTLNQNIRDYAAKIANGEDLPCFIRLDVAHFIKTYRNILAKPMRATVRVFWLAVIGQLIICRSSVKAREIIRSILIVAKSEFEGDLSNGLPTSCEIHKKKLEGLITGKFSICNFILYNCTNTSTNKKIFNESILMKQLNEQK